MPSQGAPYLDPQAQKDELKAFIAKYARSYDENADDYDRLPFAADIKEGKNDPIYNAHSYHTKVPPRSIVPYILHYTQPGDLVLDLFCGSGMTGVAAQMSADPPADILDSFPELRERVGPRACILNDLSPAACHISYNYNTPVDLEAVKGEFQRIEAATRNDFEWLYGSEHYEPAVGNYDLLNPDVTRRLKNPPEGQMQHSLLGEEDTTWELLTRSDVEARLGYPAAELQRDERWGSIDINSVKHWICIPATIQYTIWSDVYRCEGFVKVEEPTGKVSTRGKNAGKASVRKFKVQRGCGKEIVLWNVALDRATGAVSEDFKCPYCHQEWQKLSLEYQGSVPVESAIEWAGLKGKNRKTTRAVTLLETAKFDQIDIERHADWYPSTEIWAGRELMTMGANRKGVKLHSDFYTTRNLIALASLRREIDKVVNVRIRASLIFCFTSIVLKCSRLSRLRPSGAGDPLTASLYVASLIREENVSAAWERKTEKFLNLTWNWNRSPVCVVTGSATDLRLIPSSSVDYIFTDPPFGGNIYYGDASLLWEAWLDRFTDQSMELVFNRQRFQDDGFKTLKDYSDGMRAAFSEMFRVLKPGRWCTVEFNNSDGAVFQAIRSAVEDAGFEIANMLLLDKKQKSFKQVKGAKGEEDVVDKDVLFNLHKPSLLRTESLSEDHDLEKQLADAVRDHLQSLPERIRTDPDKYNDEHRTTATINSMLMNTLIPRGVSVDRLNLPFIERVCARYFRKVGQRWYLRGESIGATNGHVLIEEEVSVKDELTAIAWLRQKIDQKEMLVGELKPLWMRATGLLPASVSQELSLDNLLSENFWRDADSNRWREPTDEEREKMNDDRSIRVLHDADRFIAGTLHRTTSDGERCEWIDVLFKACRQVEDGDMQSAPALRGFDVGEAYRVITRLFQSVLREKVSTDAYTRAQKQATVATNRIAQSVREAEELQMSERSRLKGPTLFDGVD